MRSLRAVSSWDSGPGASQELETPRDLVDDATRPWPNGEHGLGPRSDLGAPGVAHEVCGQAESPRALRQLPKVGVAPSLERDLGLTAAPPGPPRPRPPRARTARPPSPSPSSGRRSRTARA